MARRSVGAVMLVALVLGMALPAMAFVIQSGGDVVVTESLHDDLYAAGQSVTVTGAIDGDVAAAARVVKLGGNVTGGVLAAARKVEIGGAVGRTIRAAGQTISIAGIVGIDVVVAGSEVTVSEQTRIGRDLLVAGQSIRVAGDVGRYARLIGDTVVVGGKVGGGLRVDARHLTILPSAIITGDVRYSGELPPDVLQGAQIKGKIERVARPSEREFTVFGLPATAVFRVWEGLGLMLIGLVIVAVAPEGTHEVATNALRRFPLSILAGLILLVLAPLVSLVLSATIIGIPLAAALLLLLGAMLYPSQAFVATGIGRILAAPIGRSRGRPVSVYVAVVMGTAVLAVLFALPYGWIVRLVAMVTGFGALWVTVRRWQVERKLAMALRVKQQ